MRIIMEANATKSLEDFIGRIEILSTDRCEGYNRTLVIYESGLV